MKTRKSITKRFKRTKTGKILRRTTGIDHYLAKKPGQVIRQKRKWVELHKTETRKIRKLVGKSW